MISVSNIKLLISTRLDRQRQEFSDIQKEIKRCHELIETLTSYSEKLNYNIDKTATLLEIIVNDENNEKSFEEIHPTI